MNFMDNQISSTPRITERSGRSNNEGSDSYDNNRNSSRDTDRLSNKMDVNSPNTNEKKNRPIEEHNHLFTELAELRGIVLMEVNKSRPSRKRILNGTDQYNKLLRDNYAQYEDTKQMKLENEFMKKLDIDKIKLQLKSIDVKTFSIHFIDYFKIYFAGKKKEEVIMEETEEENSISQKSIKI